MSSLGSGGGGGGGGSAPTGCYKCGRPGHWSRDCPSSSSAATNPSPGPQISTPYKSHTSKPIANKSSTEKPKKVPRKRPKLTPEILLSDDGLGYILRHFPSHFKFRGRGNEVADLGNLISLYAEWHSHLLPMYSFDQFIHKVEHVGSTKRVKMCVKELKERVANGGDPTKLREPPVEVSDINQEPEKASNSADPNHLRGVPFREGHDVDLPEDMFREIYKKATEDVSQSSNSNMAAANATAILSEDPSLEELPSQLPDSGANSSSKSEITAEQKARMEANRLKALEKAALAKKF